MLKPDVWESCVKRYEYLKQSDHWSLLAVAMLDLIEQIRKDPTFPETVHVVSHAWLRLGPVVDDPTYRPGVWIGWRKPNYYWIGVGAFGTQRRITVPANRVLPMLKRYLKLLSKIDPEFARYVPPEEEPEVTAHDPLADKYAALTADEVLPVLTEDIAEQVAALQQSGDQLRDLLNSLREIDAAQNKLDAILQHAEQISQLINVGLERYRIGQSLPLDDAERVMPLEPVLQTVHLNGNGLKD